MAVASNFPAIRPSLNLDFANAKSLDPRITFSRASAATYYDGKTVAKAEENLLLNSAILATQSVTTRAEPYTLSFIGTGTVTLSGTSTAGPLVGTGAANRVSLTFTPTAGTLTLTVTGAVEQAQLEARSVATAYTPTTTQPITNYIPVLQTAPAGVPRFDHNPVTCESLGLLVEEQRTNVLTYSEQLDNATWTKVGSTVASAVRTAPSGELTGAKLVEATDTASTHRVGKSFTATSGTAYSFSVYLKKSERSWVMLQFSSATFSDATAKSVYVNLEDGSSSTIPAGTALTVVNAGNGWFRFIFTVTASASATSSIALYIAQSSSILAYNGDGYSGVYIWGAQLEAGAFPTSYIKTEASQVTRAADSASMIGANFSSWYRQNEGAFLCNAASFADAQVSYIVNTNNGIVSNRLAAYFTATAPRSLGTVDGAAIFQFTGQPATKSCKTAFAYAVNNFAMSTDGSVPQTDTDGTTPLVNQLNIGHQLQSGQLNGHIKRIAYYPKRLTDAQLKALTA